MTESYLLALIYSYTYNIYSYILKAARDEDVIFLVKGNSLEFHQYLFNYVLVVIWHSGLNIADAILEDCFSGAEKRKGYLSLNWLTGPPRGEGQVSDLKCIQTAHGWIH